MGNSYSKIFETFISKNAFNDLDRLSYQIPFIDRNFDIRGNQQLPWFGGPGPGYSKESAIEYLKRRYSKVLPPIRYTLERLNKIPDFKETVHNLREEGWLDWQILNAISSIVINYRVHQLTDEYKEIHPIVK